MKYYELTYLISPDLPEEEIGIFQEKISNFIQEEEGILTEIQKPIRKKLAYPIKKRQQAYLTFLRFQLDPEKLANLDKKIKAEEEILRYLILSKKVSRPVRVPKRVVKKFLIPTEKIEKPKREKVELEEIEKKLEEILGET